jgi:hypothetical protein
MLRPTGSSDEGISGGGKTVTSESTTDITISITVGSNFVRMESRSQRFPGTFGRWVAPVSAEESPQQWANGGRFEMADDSNAEPSYFPTFPEAVDAAFAALTDDVQAEIENPE